MRRELNAKEIDLIQGYLEMLMIEIVEAYVENNLLHVIIRPVEDERDSYYKTLTEQFMSGELA